MKKTETIKENRTFRQIYRRGRSAVTPFLVLYCRPNRLGRNRLGITVSTKLGGAVVRNRARRRLREVYRPGPGLRHHRRGPGPRCGRALRPADQGLL